MFTLPELEEAAALVHTAVPPTPQYAWPLLAARAGAEVWVKHENHTPAGAFKVRGGIVFFDRLLRERPHVPGVISATRGNHGQSLARAAQAAGKRCVIVVPHGNSAEKNAAMRAFGAELIEHGADFDAAREHAAARAAQEGLEFAPSFAPDLVLGVATYALEFFRAAPPLDAVYVPVGMGSGICGLIRTRDLLRAADADHRRGQHRRAGLRAVLRRRARGDHGARGHLGGRSGLPRSAGRRAGDRLRRGRTAGSSHGRRSGGCDQGLLDGHSQSGGGRWRCAMAAILQERDAVAGQRVGAILCGGNIDLALFRAVIG